jgi:4a-hydroxytetrahydrobiopterin dehydratase
MKPGQLTDAEIQIALTQVSGWNLEGRELVKTFSFSCYLAGINFVSRLAFAAEAMNHHPELFIGWRKVSVRLSTHSSGGLTQLDFSLAGQADALMGNQGTTSPEPV